MAALAVPLSTVLRELTQAERCAVARGGSADITGTPALPAVCPGCDGWLHYRVDLGGVWAGCDCDGGYLQ